ncbi:MAG: UbiA family prenyltransferase [Bdellovibrionota bacterium]|jgi:4-hydroxybenzoate polyprenyltransferase
MQNGDLDIPLCVDLDGTLVVTDTLMEAVCSFIKADPCKAPLLLVWYFKGKARLKEELAQRVDIDPVTLPYNQEVLDFLSAERAKGRKLVLSTATNISVAKKIADHLNIFSEVIASTGNLNLKGESKAKILGDKFGVGGFDYIGDACCDVPIWKIARSALVVSSSKGFIDEVKAQVNVTQVLAAKKITFKTFLKMIRLHQWLKNLLLFIPMLAAHLVFDISVLLKTSYAFFVFCICCSGVYIINDILDLNSDRKHKEKCNRPFASGEVPVAYGMFLGPLLLISSLLLALPLSTPFIAVLVLYLITTFLYSVRLKQEVVIDIIVLASLYALRIFAGGCAGGVFVSPWLMAFAMFMFLSLACTKRFSELYNMDKTELIAGRGYRSSDIEAVSQFGIASGFISVLVLALYINANNQQQLYERPWLIWLLCPAILYWIARVWILTHRGEMNQDPIIFAMYDKISYFIAIFSVVILFLAGWTGG